MSFLLDTDICSAYLKGDGRLFNRFVQHGGRLHVSTVVVGELFSWAYRTKTNSSRLQGLTDLLLNLHLLTVDYEVARKFGEVRAALLDQVRPTPQIDLLIASTALQHDLTLVTHNIKDFSHIPNLRVEDWLA